MRCEHLVIFIAALCLQRPAAAADAEDSAAIELAAYGALYGAGLGGYLVSTLDVKTGTGALVTVVGMSTATAAVGWAGARGGDLRPGQVRLVGSATAWTMLETLLVAAALAPETKTPGWTPLLTCAAAAGTAYALTSRFDPSAGDVSLTNSGGLWLPVMAALVVAGASSLFDDPEIEDQGAARLAGSPPRRRSSTLASRPARLLLVGASMVGLGAGAALATQLEPSRSEVLALDLGLLTGGLVGAMVGQAFSDEDGVPWPVALSILGGMAGGGALAIHIAGFDGGEQAAGAGEAVSTQRRRRAPPPALPIWFGVW